MAAVQRHPKCSCWACRSLDWAAQMTLPPDSPPQGRNSTLYPGPGLPSPRAHLRSIRSCQQAKGRARAFTPLSWRSADHSSLRLVRPTAKAEPLAHEPGRLSALAGITQVGEQPGHPLEERAIALKAPPRRGEVEVVAAHLAHQDGPHRQAGLDTAAVEPVVFVLNPRRRLPAQRDAAQAHLAVVGPPTY